MLKGCLAAICRYMAYGNAVPDQILTAKGLGPKWAITWANVMVSQLLSLGSGAGQLHTLSLTAAQARQEVLVVFSYS